MKFTKTLIAAALLASAGVAQATDANFQSDAVLSIFDYTNSKSYSIDTGVSFASLDPAYTAAAQAGTATDAQLQAFTPDLSGLNLTVSAASDANFAALINAEGANDHLYWSLNGTDTNDFISTFTTSSTAAVNTQLQLAGTAEAFGGVITLIGSEVTAQSQASSTTANSIFEGSINGADAAKYGLGVSGNSGNLVTGVQVNNNLNLWAVYSNLNTNNYLADNYGALNLALTGTGAGTVATLSVVPATSSVPLPTSVWMFLSGVVGLLSFNKRKNSAV